MKKDALRPYLWPTLLALTILSASGTSELAIPDPGFELSKDKVGHFLVFGLLATTLIQVPALKKSSWRGALIALVLVGAFGAIDEGRQSLTPGRSVELADWFADFLGALTAVILYRSCRRYRIALASSIHRICGCCVSVLFPHIAGLVRN